jgi:hypothetical protein
MELIWIPSLGQQALPHLVAACQCEEALSSEISIERLLHGHVGWATAQEGMRMRFDRNGFENREGDVEKQIRRWENKTYQARQGRSRGSSRTHPYAQGSPPSV